MNAQRTYWLFTALTPVLLVVFYASKLAAANSSFPHLSGWPWWKMFAATLAFMVWALAVPGNPYVSGTGGAMAGIGAMFTSTILNALAPIFEKAPEGATK